MFENFKLDNVSRKNFLYYTAIAFAGVFMLIKMPFRLFGKKEKIESYNNDTGNIMFKANPESVKRVI